MQGLDGVFALEKSNSFRQRLHRVHSEAVDYSSLPRISFGKDKAPEVFSPRLNSDGQCPSYRPQNAIKGELPHDDEILKRVTGINLTRSLKNAQGDRKIIRCALLTDIGRSEIDDRLLTRHEITPML